MDGVLVDSMPFHVRAWELYLSKLGHDATTLNSRMHGKHNDVLLKEFFGPDLALGDIQRMGADKEALYRELIAADLDAQLISGIRDFLTLHQALPKAVASNAEAANVNFVLDSAKLRHHFAFAIDGQQVTHGKPHPEIYLKAASLLQVPAEACIVFEDSQAGIDAGLAAGMSVVGINFHRAALKGHAVEADHFLDPRLHEWIAQQL
ncbi:MAG: HAD-IA family hydrolase [Acidobacteria bacterium]|nr:HAD-IA family hydrolase [Acidobacteriota bacterium]